MAGILEDEPESLHSRTLEEPDYSSCQWFFAREFIECSSPSRQDGIDATKEAYLRNSYCTFLQDLGMRLKVPQLTIATAIVFCHRFFLRQSHAKNDRYVIATVCMFLAGKVEESPKLLQNVISVAYEIRHKKDPERVHRIKIKEVYEQEKELILVGERLVLSTLEFDLNIHHPYKPLVTAIKKLKVAQNSLAQVAWNFVNDGLRTSLCLQFKAHHIAAGAIFLAAKFLKVKLPSNDKKPWWQEFNVTPRQLEDVSNQMLELYERNRDISSSRHADPSGSTNHDKKGGHALHPSTPQVAEKRSGVEDKAKTVAEPSQQPQNHGDSKTSLMELEQMNIEKLKTAVQKKRKLKAEGGGARLKQGLTDEEELLEKEMENGHRDCQEDDSSNVHNATDHQTRYSSTGAGASKLSIHTGLTDDELEGDNVEGFSENRLWSSHLKEHNHTSQFRRTNEADYHHLHQKGREWKERELKRLCQ